MPIPALSKIRISAFPFWSSLLTSVALLSIATYAHAAPAYPKAIKEALANGAKVVKSFPAASGLTGWILSENGTYSVVYTTADKRTLIVGNLFNEKGENLTDKFAEKYFPRPHRSSVLNQPRFSQSQESK